MINNDPSMSVYEICFQKLRVNQLWNDAWCAPRLTLTNDSKSPSSEKASLSNPKQMASYCVFNNVGMFSGVGCTATPHMKVAIDLYQVYM